MPLYEIEHISPLSRSQKDALAASITQIHSHLFTTPSLFVNVRFTNISNQDVYIGGKKVYTTSQFSFSILILILLLHLSFIPPASTLNSTHPFPFLSLLPNTHTHTHTPPQKTRISTPTLPNPPNPPRNPQTGSSRTSAPAAAAPSLISTSCAKESPRGGTVFSSGRRQQRVQRVRRS